MLNSITNYSNSLVFKTVQSRSFPSDRFAPSANLDHLSRDVTINQSINIRLIKAWQNAGLQIWIIEHTTSNKGYINKMFRSNIGVGQPDPNMCFGTAYV